MNDLHGNTCGRDLVAVRISAARAAALYFDESEVWAYFDSLPEQHDYCDGHFRLKNGYSRLGLALDAVWEKVGGQFKYYTVYERQ